MSDYAVVNPATGETVKEYPTITDDELREAIARADAAFRSWGRGTTPAERAELIRRVGDLHSERREELAAIIVREMGKPIEQALAEVDFAADIYRYYADLSPKVLEDEPIDLLAGEGSAVIRRSPLGVLLGIMPWNFPYYQVARFAGPNLIIGNAILLKHAPQCPESALAIEKIFHDAGIPQDAYINIFATNDQIEWLIADRRLQGVSLTGSEWAGAAVAEIAGRNLKKVVLELGGSDPFIVLSADDLDKVAEDAAAARLDNSGQSCNAAKRFIVVDELYEPFVEKLTASGVVVAIGHTAATGDQIRAAVRAGARTSTHLGNGAHAVLPRHPNYIWDQLAEDGLWASIIPDGYHLPPAVVKCVVRAKGLDRTLITCNASSLAGMPAGRYREWGTDLEVLSDGKVVVAGTPATVQVDGKDGYKLSLAVEQVAAGGKLKLSAALASGYGEMSPVLVVTAGEPATVAVGDLAMSVTVTPAPGRAAADAPPASAMTL